MARLPWSTAESYLVTVGIAVRDLAHTVRIGLLLRRIESPISNVRNERIQVIDEQRVHGVASMFGLLRNIHIPMLRKLPHGLCLMWKECRWAAQQLFVPFERCGVVGDRDAREQIEAFGLNHSS
jgi:hypothetical protein